MKSTIITLFLGIGFFFTFAQQPPTETITTLTTNTPEQKAIIELSKQKWDWMAEKNVDHLQQLFHDKSMFIHMGGTCGEKPGDQHNKEWRHLV